MDSREEDRLRELAEQLRNPHGDEGMQVAAKMHATNLEMTRCCFAAVSLGANETVLEIGHGNGAHIPEFFAAQPTIRYQGLEISPLMTDAASEANRQRVHQGSVRLATYDGTTFPFPAAHFDAVMTVNTLYFVPDPVAFLFEVHRTLRVGGRLAIAFAPRSFMQHLSFAQYGFQLYETEEVIEMLAATGFGDIDAQAYQELVASKERTGETIQRDFVVVRALRNRELPTHRVQ